MDEVYIIETVGGHGGMNYYDMELARGLVNAGWRVHLYTSAETKEVDSDNIVIKRYFRGIYGSHSILRKALNYLRGVCLCLADTIRHCGRLVHYHVFHFDMRECITVLLIKATGRKCVLTVHDVECLSGRKNKSISRLILWMADGLIVHNEYSLHELAVARGRDLSNKAHLVISSGNFLTSINSIDKSAAKHSLGISPDRPVVLFFGQIKKAKGLDLLLRAVPEVTSKHGDVCFVVAGREWDVRVKDYTKNLDTVVVNRHCLFITRFIEDEEKDRLYSAADIVVLPYRKIYQSGVLLMAMSYGKCVVASDIPGMTAVIRDGDNGFLFTDGDADELAQVLNNLLDTPGKCQAAAERAYNIMRDDYDWNIVGKKVAEFYSHVR